MINKASWERGFAHGSIYKTLCIDLTEKVKEGSENMVFGIGRDSPHPLKNLDADGLPCIGSRLEYGDPFYSYLNLSTGESFVSYHK